MTRKTKNWIVRGGWALVDQGLFAFANVLLNVLLARWLTATEYGAFAVAYSLFLFLGAFHTALITEPYLVFGAGKFGKQAAKYSAIVLRGHWYLVGVGSLLLAIGAFVMSLLHEGLMAQSLFGLAMAGPFSLLMWLARRAAYLNLQTRLATIGSAAYALLTAAGLFALSELQIVSVFSAMLVVGAAGAISGFLLWAQAGRSIRDRSFEELETRTVFCSHWRYGRWACATSTLMWVPLNLFFVVLSISANLEASATLKALSNLVLPMLQANAALGALLLPVLVARVNDVKKLASAVRLCLALFAAGALAYSVSVSIFARPIVHVLYGGQYDNQLLALYLLLAIPLFDGIMMVLSSTLRAFELPSRVFWSQLVVAFIVLSLGVLAASYYGLFGAAGSIVLAEGVGAGLLAMGVIRRIRRSANGLASDTWIEQVGKMGFPPPASPKATAVFQAFELGEASGRKPIFPTCSIQVSPSHPSKESSNTTCR